MDEDADDGEDPLAWETLASGIDYDCPGFSVRRDEVRLPDGTETAFHSVTDDPSVVVLPFTTDGDVVVIEEWRQAVERVNYGLPAGGVEDEDGTGAEADLAATAHRELTEETGYEAAAVEHLASHEPSNGLFDTVFHYFVAHGCEATGEQALDANESIRVRTATFDELRDAALTGAMPDGRSALGILHYALRAETE
jgi:ADP-ribose pyrophosphatase